MIDTIVVSTQEQKDGLIEVLKKYHCDIPDIKVILAGGIEYLKYPEKPRRPYSLIAVSRLSIRKKVDWIVKSVIKAHSLNSNITLDIYGRGECWPDLEKIVEEHGAKSYIKFMGYCDVTDVYKNYEVFITASIWETLGLSTMEAIGFGASVIGLDVPYGNRLFVKNGENGYLVDYDKDNVDEEKLINTFAEKIIEIFEDEQRLEQFHQASYKNASRFFTQIIEEKWKNLSI